MPADGEFLHAARALQQFVCARSDVPAGYALIALQIGRVLANVGSGPGLPLPSLAVVAANRRNPDSVRQGRRFERREGLANERVACSQSPSDPSPGASVRSVRWPAGNLVAGFKPRDPTTGKLAGLRVGEAFATPPPSVRSLPWKVPVDSPWRPAEPANPKTVIMRVQVDNMIRTQISVDRELYERAKSMARRQGISLAELCRRSLQETVSREPVNKPWMAYAGVLDGEPDDSDTVDEVVYGRSSP